MSRLRRHGSMDMEFIIITGMSGGGKSQAANILEDAGYYCIDNMPAKLIPEFASLYNSAMREKDVVFIIDVRGEKDFNSMFESIDALKAGGYTCKTLFIECADAVLINRYKETRRTHPLISPELTNISDAIAKERKMMAQVKERCDYVIDTSKTTLLQLRQRVNAVIGKAEGENGALINCMSFGFKNGGVTEADLVFDVRCFPNPFYVPALRPHTGLDDDVKAYVFASEETREFAAKLYDMVEYLLPLYIKEGRHQITVAIGCTGGKHRSVAIAEALCSELCRLGYKAVSFHRDINRE